jgi:hypothetical protein
MKAATNLEMTFHMPAALSGTQTFGLPPCAPQRAYAVDSYPGCPESWMRGDGTTQSFFVGVEPGRGMWLDFNGCFQHTHDVAVLVSVQGINPITGKAFDKNLEQFKERCPVHDVAFETERFCPSCKYKWPAQNYISTKSTPRGLLWIDGFRTDDGSVRQYVFTEDEARGVASQLIGEARVFAIGVSFYLSKEKKPHRPYTGIRGVDWENMPIGSSLMKGSLTPPPVSVWQTDHSTSSDINDCTSAALYCASMDVSHTLGGGEMKCMSLDNKEPFMTPRPTRGGQSVRRLSANNVAPVNKKIEIAAGAQIRQQLYDDTESVEVWQNEPAGRIIINYCSKEMLASILETGKREEGAGFLDRKGILVGN